MRRSVVIDWGVSSYFGYGVYGLNLALAWSQDSDLELVTTEHVDLRDLALDAIRLRSLDRFLERSRRFRAQLDQVKGPTATISAPLLAALSSDFRLPPTGEELRVIGTPTIGIVFFENAQHTPAALERAAGLPLIIAGSSWNEQVLRAHGLTNVRTIVQGVDPFLFHPAQSTRADDRFLVFSGGKLELRKGQDIALAAFRKFAERHRDAVLVAAWHSPWPTVASRIDRSGLAAPVAFRPDGTLDAAGWAAANGIRPEQFIDAGQTPNPLMPQLLRQIDVALFPNRSEGGTNLVAMECMACGVPTILSANTGHLDLIENENCFVLTRQDEVTFEPGAGPYGEVRGWGESDVQEAVELLEQAYRDRQEARRRGLRGAETLARLPWSRTAAELKDAVLSLAGAGA